MGRGQWPLTAGACGQWRAVTAVADSLRNGDKTLGPLPFSWSTLSPPTLSKHGSFNTSITGKDAVVAGKLFASMDWCIQIVLCVTPTQTSSSLSQQIWPFNTVNIEQIKQFFSSINSPLSVCWHFPHSRINVILLWFLLSLSVLKWPF